MVFIENASQLLHTLMKLQGNVLANDFRRQIMF
jgi:hypothetical protein